MSVSEVVVSNTNYRACVYATAIRFQRSTSVSAGAPAERTLTLLCATTHPPVSAVAGEALCERFNSGSSA